MISESWESGLQKMPCVRRGLGALYAIGQGVKKSYTEAFKWFRKSADQGNIHALHTIGLAYKDGIGVRQSYSKAKEYFGLACDKGDDSSCYWYPKCRIKVTSDFYEVTFS